MTTDSADWAGTTADRYDLHRFDGDRRALCNPAIRTHSRRTANDRTREPYATLRTRAQIEASGFGHLHRFCPTCAAA